MEKVARVIDGDTFDTDTGVRIRLARVNAPGADNPQCEDITRYLLKFLEGRKISVRSYRHMPPKLARRDALDSAKKSLAVQVMPVDMNFGGVVAEVVLNGASVNNAMRNFIKNPRRRSAPRRRTARAQ